MGQDAEGTAKRRNHARQRSPEQSVRQGINNAGARYDDNNQRGDKEINAHVFSITT